MGRTLTDRIIRDRERHDHRFGARPQIDVLEQVVR
jgi:hypothetical protein